MIVKDTEYFAHNEEELREMVRQLRRMGYPGSLGMTIHYNSGKCSVVVKEDYDGVRRELAVPEGIMPDWTYPVNSKGETYSHALGCDILGYDPDLIPCRASNGEEGYITTRSKRYTNYPGDEPHPNYEDYRTWLWSQPKIIQVPVYDLNRDNMIGYSEVSNDGYNEYIMSPEEFEDRSNTLLESLERMGMSEKEIAQGLKTFQKKSKVVPEMTLDELRQAYGW